jgi:cytochrome P450
MDPAETGTLNLDASCPAFTDDPYPLLAELREAAPVRRVKLLGLPMWLVTRYEDVRALFGSAALSCDARHASDEARAQPYVRGTDEADGSLLAALAHMPADQERLDDGELAALAYLLLIAGYTTTVDLIGNGMLALLCNPDELAALRADPLLALDPAADLHWRVSMNIRGLRRLPVTFTPR